MPDVGGLFQQGFSCVLRKVYSFKEGMKLQRETPTLGQRQESVSGVFPGKNKEHQSQASSVCSSLEIKATNSR